MTSDCPQTYGDCEASASPLSGFTMPTSGVASSHIGSLCIYTFAQPARRLGTVLHAPCVLHTSTETSSHRLP